MYWIIINDTEQGPYSLEQLSGIGLTADTPVWREGMADWLPASQVDELADLMPAPQPPAIPVEETAEAAVDMTVKAPVTPAPVIYAPADAIPAGYVAIAPAAEPVCPPSYLVWAIIATVVCFLPFGVCAIICAAKVKGHFRAGRLEKASRMSERAALFVILSIVAWLIWMPFSVVFAML